MDGFLVNEGGKSALEKEEERSEVGMVGYRAGKV